MPHLTRSAAALLALTAVTRAQNAPATRPAPPASLKLTIPAGWQNIAKPQAGGNAAASPTMVALGARETNGIFSIRITFVRADQPDAFDDDTLRALLTKAAEPFLGGSEETAITPQALDGKDVHGFYATLTAKDAKAGDAACITLAHVKLGNGVLAATIRHPNGSPNLPKAIGMIKTATLAAPAPQPAAKVPATKPAGKPTGVRPHSSAR